MRRNGNHQALHGCAASDHEHVALGRIAFRVGIFVSAGFEINERDDDNGRLAKDVAAGYALLD